MATNQSTPVETEENIRAQILRKAQRDDKLSVGVLSKFGYQTRVSAASLSNPRLLAQQAINAKDERVGGRQPGLVLGQ